MADGRVIIDTKLDTTGLESGIKSINSLLKAGFVTKGLAYLGQALRKVTDETGELNDSLRMASTLFGGYDVDMERLATRLRRISNETQVAASELGMGLYNALSSGIPASEDMGEALEFVEKNALAAKAGMADLDSTVRTSASVMNAYGMSVEDTDRILGVLMATQNLGITTIAELSTTLAQVIPTAAAFGVSFEEVGAALATMTAMGTQTAQATTGLNNLLSELGRQSQQGAKNLTAAAEAAGLGEKSFADLVKDGHSLTDILLMMQSYAEAGGKSLVDMFGSIEGGRAALQLVTQDGQTFTNNLASMADTEGMVEQASATVMTETDRLGRSLANAASTIGGALVPAWSEIAGMMADTIDSLTGNRDRAGELETALINLESATKAYKEAQEEAAGATDETTAAMLRQAAEAQRQAILEFADAYRAAMDENVANAEGIQRAQGIIDEMNGRLQALADQAGMTMDEMQDAYARGRLPEGYVGEYEQFTHEIEHQEGVIQTLNGGLDDLKASYDSVVSSAVRMVSEGSLSIDDLAASSGMLASTVRRLVGSYEGGQTLGSSLIDHTDAENLKAFRDQFVELQSSLDSGTGEYYRLQGAIDACNDALSAMAATSSTGSSPTVAAPTVDTDAVKTVMQSLRTGLRTAAGEFELLGDESQWVGDSISALQSALTGLLDAGLEPADAQIQAVVAQLESFQAKADAIASRDALQAIADDLDAALGAAEARFRLLGDEEEHVEEQTRALESALSDYLNAGLDETDGRVRDVVDRLKELEAQAAATSSELRGTVEDINAEFRDNQTIYKLTGDYTQYCRDQVASLERAMRTLADEGLEYTDYRLVQTMEQLEEWRDKLAKAETGVGALADTLADTFGNADMWASTLSDGIQAAMDVVIETPERLRELEDSTLEATESMTEAYEELSEARARGDTQAIEALEDQIAAYQAVIDANKEEKKALESGEEAWKAFGKSALEALADVLYGLAEQLAAQAISASLSFNWAGAAAAAAGSVAAFAAAAAVDAWAGSYASGGIVPQKAGVPTTGDRLVASVNPGELILNRAQQESIAAQLAMADAQRALAASASGGSMVVVNLSGAYIYGLDEPAVGRAIYENIRTLQAEGVLR